jgi:pleiotropic regulator 1
MHPKLDVLVTGGRDTTTRVWDIRTKAEVHVLKGHTNAVTCVDTQSSDPQVRLLDMLIISYVRL